MSIRPSTTYFYQHHHHILSNKDIFFNLFLDTVLLNCLFCSNRKKTYMGPKKFNGKEKKYPKEIIFLLWNWIPTLCIVILWPLYQNDFFFTWMKMYMYIPIFLFSSTVLSSWMWMSLLLSSFRNGILFGEHCSETPPVASSTTVNCSNTPWKYKWQEQLNISKSIIM